MKQLILSVSALSLIAGISVANLYDTSENPAQMAVGGDGSNQNVAVGSNGTGYTLEGDGTSGVHHAAGSEGGVGTDLAAVGDGSSGVEEEGSGITLAVGSEGSNIPVAAVESGGVGVHMAIDSEGTGIAIAVGNEGTNTAVAAAGEGGSSIRIATDSDGGNSIDVALESEGGIGVILAEIVGTGGIDLANMLGEDGSGKSTA